MALCLAMATVAPKAAVAGLAAATLALVVVGLRRERRLARLAARAEAIAPGAGPQAAFPRLAAGLDRIEAMMATLDTRIDQHHPLTGLPTREPLIARMADDGGGTLGAIAFADFDRLCAFDPALADSVLLALVHRMRRMLPADRPIAQIGRAHLAIWFGPTTPADEADALLDALGYALSGPVRSGNDEILPDIVVRRLCYPDDGPTPHAVVARAMSALALGPGQSAGPSRDVELAARERFLLEQDLRQAVARGELALAYQPLVDAGEARVCGAEALLRWQHPVRGAVPPSRFVPVMEAAGLADEVGAWALNTAVRAARSWATLGLEDLRVAVNVSGQQLEHGRLPLLVARTLGHHCLPADRLEIELTESVALGDTTQVTAMFEALRATGVRLAIDDFGTGFSSFSSLRRLAFDKIKIDREFVSGVDRQRDSQAICQAIIALGRGLGKAVLAEGVETAAEFAWLRRHGCRHFQGYFIAQPLSGDAFVAFARDRAGLAARLALDPAAQQRMILERLTA